MEKVYILPSMVIMAVGQEDFIHRAAQLLHGVQNHLRLPAGIDNAADLGALIAENIAVRADGAYL